MNQWDYLVKSAFDIQIGKVIKVVENRYTSTEIETKNSLPNTVNISSSVTHHSHQSIYFKDFEEHERHIEISNWNIAVKEDDKVAFAYIKGWPKKKLLAIFNSNLNKRYFKGTTLTWFGAFLYGVSISIIPALNVLFSVLSVLTVLSLLMPSAKRQLMIRAGLGKCILFALLFFALSLYTTTYIISLPWHWMILNCLLAIIMLKLIAKMDSNIEKALFNYIELTMRSFGEMK